MSYPPHEPTEPTESQSYGPQPPPVDPYADQTQQVPANPPPGQQVPPTRQMPTGYPPPGQQRPPPRWPPVPPGPATQAAALQQAIALSSARGWRLEGTSPGVATMVSGYRPNHVLHLLLTIFTCGLWAIGWIIIAATATEKRLTIVADLDGNVSYTQGPYPAPPTAQGAYPPPQQPKPLAITTGGWVAIGAGALAAVVLLAVAMSLAARSSSTRQLDQSRNNDRLYDPPTPSDTVATSAVTTPPAPPTTQAAPPPPPPKPTIREGTWTVGTDFPAGTYRTIGAGSACYWKITKSGSNDSDIVNNHIGGGNLTVTLSSGQDFTTERCGTWTKVE